MLRSAVVGIALLAASTARADDVDDPAPAPRPFHGSVGAGGSFLFTGEQGDRFRIDFAFDLKLRSRYGVLLAAHAVDIGTSGEVNRKGLVVASVIYEAAAARPRLVLDLHAGAGADLDARAPVAGGGIRTTLAIYKLVGLAFDLGAYLVVDGLDDTRLQIQNTTFLVARW